MQISGIYYIVDHQTTDRIRENCSAPFVFLGVARWCFVRVYEPIAEMRGFVDS
jgi:hypothetical protein